jgi:tetratricopeptide (TPR) repeat protein
MRAGWLGPGLAAIAFAVATLVCAMPVPAQVTHADSGGNRDQDRLPSDPAGAVERARKEVAASDLAGAIKELALYVAAHPREIEPARYLADLHYRNSDLAAAKSVLLAILVYAPKDRETHNRLGGIYAAQDNIGAAIDEFQRSLPSNGAFLRLVELHRKRGDLASFTDEYRNEADQRPQDGAAQFNYGQILLAEHRSAEAIGFFQRALDIDPRSCQTLSELGSAYIDVNNVRDAVFALQRCLTFEPGNYGAIVNLAVAEIVDGQISKARIALERANQVRPDGAEALVDLGYIEDMQGRWESAITYYLKALDVDPLCRDAYVNLGYDYDGHHLYKLAEAAFIKGLSISPDDGRLHYLLGVTYADQGKKALALVEYEHAKTSDEPEVARAATRDLTLLQSGAM